MEKEAEPTVFLIDIVFHTVFFCEEKDGANPVAVFADIAASFGQSVCR